MNPQNQKHTKWIEHRGYSGQHPFKEVQCQSGKNSGCYTYEHITVAMSIPGIGLTSASITPAEIRVFQGRICYIKDKSRFKAESSSISGSRAGTEP